MNFSDILIIFLVALATGAVFLLIGVLLEFSLRKARPLQPPPPDEEGLEAAIPEAPVVAEPPPRLAPKTLGLGLRRTRENFLGRIRAAITGSANIDRLYESLEEALIEADVGVEASMKLVDGVRQQLKGNSDPEMVRGALKNQITLMLESADKSPTLPESGPLSTPPKRATQARC